MPHRPRADHRHPVGERSCAQSPRGWSGNVCRVRRRPCAASAAVARSVVHRPREMRPPAACTAVHQRRVDEVQSRPDVARLGIGAARPAGSTAPRRRGARRARSAGRRRRSGRSSGGRSCGRRSGPERGRRRDTASSAGVEPAGPFTSTQTSRCARRGPAPRRASGPAACRSAEACSSSKVSASMRLPASAAGARRSGPGRGAPRCPPSAVAWTSSSMPSTHRAPAPAKSRGSEFSRA